MGVLRVVRVAVRGLPGPTRELDNDAGWGGEGSGGGGEKRGGAPGSCLIAICWFVEVEDDVAAKKSEIECSYFE